jgi:(p)ppGpp synthase/HD superfamily hydrolase
VLHDVIEDSKVTAADPRSEGFSDAVVAAVEALIRREMRAIATLSWGRGKRSGPPGQSCRPQG